MKVPLMYVLFIANTSVVVSNLHGEISSILSLNVLTCEGHMSPEPSIHMQYKHNAGIVKQIKKSFLFPSRSLYRESTVWGTLEMVPAGLWKYIVLANRLVMRTQ